MASCDFFTFCCPKDIKRLAQPGELTARVNSHGYKFDNVFVIRQRCGHDFDDIIFSSPDFAVTELHSEDFPNIIQEFGLPDYDPRADEITHGPSGPHYWKNHVTNHITALKVSTADYIAFSDCDCRILEQPSSWIYKGMELLEAWPRDILIVSPSDGGSMAERILSGGIRLTQNVSQQMFLCNRVRMLGMDFNYPWDGQMDAPGGPFPEYYYLLEGRIWRWLRAKKLYRAILNHDWRYWHDQWH